MPLSYIIVYCSFVTFSKDWIVFEFFLQVQQLATANDQLFCNDGFTDFHNIPTSYLLLIFCVAVSSMS